MSSARRALACLVIAIAVPALAFKAPAPPKTEDDRSVIHPDLVFGMQNVPLEDALRDAPVAAGVTSFLASHPGWKVHLDPRSGRPSAVTDAFIPLIPGTGVGNTLTLADLSAKLGRPVASVDAIVVAELLRAFATEHAGLLGIEPAELGPPRVGNPVDYLWEAHFPRVHRGVLVRDSSLTFAINHGNVVLMGLEKWGDVDVPVIPALRAEDAYGLTLARLDGPAAGDRLWILPHLELVPTAPPAHERAGTFAGPIGAGYAYRLAWVLGVDQGASWESIVDAVTGEILALRDLNATATRKIVGGVYPVSNDGQPPDGVEQAAFPMPFANTGFGAPNDFTNSAGEYDYTSGTVTTTLVGKYVRILDQCTGALSESSATGNLDLGTSGGDDCTVPAGHSADDTHSARSGFYELNRIKEMGRNFLPANVWLTQRLDSNMNINLTCNAFWSPSSQNVNFYRSGGGCGNTGEIAAIFDHEWGHGMDDNDTNGSISSPGEAIADIFAGLRLHTSCVGRGFLVGTNCDGYGDSCLDCSGVRDIDYAMHTSGTPHSPQNFINPLCPASGSLGPCSRETHCEGMVAAEAAWDLAARDLQQAPFNMNVDTAFLVASRMAFQGSGNMANFYTCSGGGTSSNGCGATNGYTLWLASDDDDGNVGNGTPHASALWNAFQRHGIACGGSAPPNSGCGSGPTQAPTLTATWSVTQVQLSWNTIPNAANYLVYKGEGPNGCDFGKILIATVASPTTTYTDTQVNDTSLYTYVVVPVGSNAACIGPASNCAFAGPPSAVVTDRSFTDDCPGGGVGDGDGRIDQGETITLPVTIYNSGGQTLTGITGTITTSTPGITITDGSAGWANLDPGNSGVSNNPFAFTVDPSVVCESAVNFTVTVNTAQGGPYVGALAPLTVGGFTLSSPVTTASADVPKAIPDNTTITSVINLADTRKVGDVNVTLNITHTYDADLVLTLIGPNGTRVTLAGGVGGSGDNFTNTTFDDEAANPIGSGTPPFTGSFRPTQPLSALDGIAGNGTWTLEIQDTATQDIGTLNSWSVTIVYRNPLCNTCSLGASTPKEASPSDNMTATKGAGNTVNVTFTPASCATNHAIYVGSASGPMGGAPVWASSTCNRGTSGTTTVDLNPAAGSFSYFVIVGVSATEEGSYGQMTSGERPQATGVGSCDLPQDLVGSCP